MEDVHIEENINAAIARFNGITPVLVSEVQAVSCAGVAKIYYGVYDSILQPLARYLLRCGIYATAIAFHLVLLTFLALSVNRRLGSGGGGGGGTRAAVNASMPLPTTVAIPVASVRSGGSRSSRSSSVGSSFGGLRTTEVHLDFNGGGGGSGYDDDSNTHEAVMMMMGLNQQEEDAPEVPRQEGSYYRTMEEPVKRE